MLPPALLKLLKAKTHIAIRDARLWEVTTIFGIEVYEVEQDPIAAARFTPPEPLEVDGTHRVHVIVPENNVTNLTKHADLL